MSELTYITVKYIYFFILYFYLGKIMSHLIIYGDNFDYNLST